MNPKLLFPLKAWLRGFLPGHQFTWEEENYCDETDIKDKVKCDKFFKIPALEKSIRYIQGFFIIWFWFLFLERFG